MQMHSMSVEMDTQYILDAVTLKSDVSKMVLLADHKRASGHHINYRDFVQDRLQNNSNAQLDEQIGRHFILVERKEVSDPIQSVNKRFMTNAYEEAVPIFSADQTLVFIPRYRTRLESDKGNPRYDRQDPRFRLKKNVEKPKHRTILDIFDCANASFFGEGTENA